MDGIETARRLGEADARAVVVLMSMEEIPELPSSIASVGAEAYLRKQDLTTAALREIWKVHGARTG